MKMETLKKNHLKRNILIAVVVVLVISAVILQFTRARYRVTQSIPLVNGVINYTAPDLNTIALYVDGISTDTLPTGNYELTSASYCEIDGERAEVTLSYDSSTQALSVTPFTTRGTKCYLYFEEVTGTPIIDVIEEAYANNQDILAYDGTEDNNLRYIGADPANYVYFNCSDYSNPSSSTCELWRIIGIFNENTHGVSGERLVKLIRNESLGTLAWDSGRSNDWSIASLQETLNGDYLNRTGDYSSTGITDATRDTIETVTWKLGGGYYYTAANFYTAERGTRVYSGHATEWEGKIALMYPSDFGYATSGGSTGRVTCLNYNLNDWDDYSDCYNNDWLNYSSAIQWTLTSRYSTSNHVFYVTNSGRVNYSVAYGSYVVRPSLYLASNVSIKGGTGTESDPYTLQV
mgnify:CR=1 FL=1